jgi:hypothetical protein
MVLPLTFVVSCGVAAVFLYMGFKDNNQGEFYDLQTGAIDIPYSSMLFVSVFIPCFIALNLAAMLWHAASLLFRHMFRPGER